MSNIRKHYTVRLVGRCIILVLCVLLSIYNEQIFSVLDGMSFFSQFSVLHLLWLIWIFDMLLQLIPSKSNIALGSQKIFKFRFSPADKKTDKDALDEYTKSSTKGAYKVFIIWAIVGTLIGFLHYIDTLDNTALFLIAVIFYVCDLICVLVWCPFRLIMKNRCCTTCRIFNWNHIMMFMPLLFIKGFYGLSLCALAIIVWCKWEITAFLHPERFWEHSNTSLKCKNCTDKLCPHRFYKPVKSKKNEI